MSHSASEPITATRARFSRRAVGKAMIVVGVLGILMGITTVVAGRNMIRQVEASVDDSLRLTGEALNAVTDSIAVTESIVGSVRTGMTSIRTTISTVQKSLTESSATLAEGGAFLGGSLPAGLEAINTALPTLESLAKSVDDTLELLDEVPFGPNYQPVEPFDVAINRLSTALAPIPTELRALSGDFDALTKSTAAMAVDIGRLGRDIETLNIQLSNVGTLLSRYEGTAARAKTLTRASQADLARSADLTSWLLVALGVVLTLGQIVPIWLGSVLLSSEGVITTTITDTDGPGRATA